MKNGESFEAKTFPAITQAALRDYAEASGDHNPIHLDEDAAKAAGLPGVIAHGMLISGYMAQTAHEVAAKELGSVRWVHYQTRFKSMTFLGDVTTISGSVKSRTDREFVLELQAKNQKGEITATGNAKFSVR